LSNFKTLAAALFFIFISLSSYSQGEGDRIIAIVGNDVILQSDLNFQLYNYMQQNGIQQINNDIVQQVFQNLLTEKLMLAKAEQDSIYIPQDEVNKQVDARLKELVAQFGSEKNLEGAYGVTISRIKTLVAEQYEKNAKVNRVKQQKFGYGITVTKPEVTQFYNDYRDSLPPVAETYDLYQIIRIPKVTEDAKNIAKQKALVILDSVKMGIDFSDLAKRNSDDSLSAIEGGSLGKAKKGTFVKEFEDAAFILKPGEVSDIVESEFGYHIIKLNDKTGDFITTQHILVKFPRLEIADFTEINFLKDLKTKIKNGEITFKQAAITHSQEPKTAADSGYIGKLAITSMEEAEVLALKDLSIGDISDPVKVGDDRYYGYYMYYVNDKIPEHPISLETDYAMLEQYALKLKEQKILNEWLDELKKTIYVDIKL
jgi:peptidyl-prolyl cis-trans isomerase SurA